MNESYQVPGNSFISSYEIKTKMIAAAVSLVQQLVAVAVTRWLLYMYV